MLSNSVINIRLNIEKKPSKPSWNSRASKDKQKINFLDNFFFLELDIFTLVVAVFCDEVNKKCHL